MANKAKSLGVIIARLHVDDLHEGHYDLLKEVYDTNTCMLVIVGLSPLKCTIKNPLDFDTRRRMISSHFPNAKIAYINDVGDNDIWSANLDSIIAKYEKEFDDVVLYGSRDSFIQSYSGRYKTKEVEQRVFMSGTQIRNQIALRSKDTVDFRAGAIWFALNQTPIALPTVHVGFLSLDTPVKKILLSKKAEEQRYRIIGGEFVKPNETYEIAACEALYNKAALSIEEDLLNIERSFFINDWKFKNEVNKVVTCLFTVIDWQGRPTPSDDILEIHWFDLDTSLDYIHPEHKQMLAYLIKKYTCKC